MNWYRNPHTVEALAANYVMGNMSARTRRRFERIMARRTDVAMEANDWATRALPVALSLPAQSPSFGAWQRLAKAAGVSDGESTGLQADSPKSPQPPWWQRWLTPFPAAALALGLALGLSLPVAWQAMNQQMTEMQLPESYVGVLATADGKPGLIVSSLRRGTVVDLKVIAPITVPPGYRQHLWRIDKAGVATALGVLPTVGPDQKILHLNLAEPAEKAFFAAVELAVSIEPETKAGPLSNSAPRSPTLPYVYRGLCGKVWR